jgi:hypothetical protein
MAKNESRTPLNFLSIPRNGPFPFAIVAGGVEDLKHDDGIGPEHEGNAIWEASG